MTGRELAAERLVTRLRIGNVYGHGFGEAGRATLESLGFRFRSEVSRYPGAQLCSFLDFSRGPGLELIEVEDEREYLDFVPPGMEPYCPGISLVAAGSTVGPAEVREQLQDLGPYDLHVPYDARDPAGPGWRYLNFETPVVPGAFTWFTAFDEPRPVPPRATAHPNGVARVVGLAFDLPAVRLERLAEVTGATEREGAFSIDDVHVWAADIAAELPSAGTKAFPLVAVVLEALSSDAFASARDRVSITFAREPAVLVEMGRTCWDLVIRAAATRGS